MDAEGDTRMQETPAGDDRADAAPAAPDDAEMRPADDRPPKPDHAEPADAEPADAQPDAQPADAQDPHAERADQAPDDATGQPEPPSDDCPPKEPTNAGAFDDDGIDDALLMALPDPVATEKPHSPPPAAEPPKAIPQKPQPKAPQQKPQTAPAVPQKPVAAPPKAPAISQKPAASEPRKQEAPKAAAAQPNHAASATKAAAPPPAKSAPAAKPPAATPKPPAAAAAAPKPAATPKPPAKIGGGEPAKAAPPKSAVAAKPARHAAPDDDDDEPDEQKKPSDAKRRAPADADAGREKRARDDAPNKSRAAPKKAESDADEASDESDADSESEEEDAEAARRDKKRRAPDDVKGKHKAPVDAPAAPAADEEETQEQLDAPLCRTPRMRIAELPLFASIGIVAAAPAVRPCHNCYLCSQPPCGECESCRANARTGTKQKRCKRASCVRRIVSGAGAGEGTETQQTALATAQRDLAKRETAVHRMDAKIRTCKIEGDVQGIGRLSRERTTEVVECEKLRKQVAELETAVKRLGKDTPARPDAPTPLERGKSLGATQVMSVLRHINADRQRLACAVYEQEDKHREPDAACVQLRDALEGFMLELTCTHGTILTSDGDQERFWQLAGDANSVIQAETRQSKRVAEAMRTLQDRDEEELASRPPPASPPPAKRKKPSGGRRAPKAVSPLVSDDAIDADEPDATPRRT